jgi:sec-independent protein translocase protein TatA
MALFGYEWVIVAVILLVLFLWGPKKLPELAKALGLAKKEFKEATKETPGSEQTSEKKKDNA